MENLELWLVRHGETLASRDGVLAGWADVPLTPRGVAQAEAVRPALEGEGFDGVWCSRPPAGHRDRPPRARRRPP